MNNWAMFPKADEQEMILQMPIERLAKKLIDSADGHLIAAVYDLIYAAKDEERAKQLLLEAAKTIPRENLADRAGRQITLRIHMDNQPEEAQERFKTLVQEWLGVKINPPNLSGTESLIVRLLGIAYTHS